MKREDAIAESAMIVIAIRELQATHHKAHEKLLNWGRYSRHRDDRPAWIVTPGWCHEAPANKWEFDGEESEDAKRVEYTTPPERGDRREPEPYDEKSARLLCERMHGPGGLPDYVRSVVKVAYYEQRAREEEYHLYCNPTCQPHAFRERLEEALKFVGRFS